MQAIAGVESGASFILADRTCHARFLVSEHAQSLWAIAVITTEPEIGAGDPIDVIARKDS